MRLGLIGMLRVRVVCVERERMDVFFSPTAMEVCVDVARCVTGG